jgi:hypothetical protein
MTAPRSRFSADAVDPCRPVVEGHAGGPYYALMVEALHKLLLERDLLSQADTDRVIATLEAPNAQWGAHLVAQAWRQRRGISTAIASAAMPSRRPVKPRPSVVVAFTLTASRGRPRSSAVRARIASR